MQEGQHERNGLLVGPGDALPGTGARSVLPRVAQGISRTGRYLRRGGRRYRGAYAERLSSSRWKFQLASQPPVGERVRRQPPPYSFASSAIGTPGWYLDVRMASEERTCATLG